jgi:hypothetical protein
MENIKVRVNWQTIEKGQTGETTKSGIAMATYNTDLKTLTFDQDPKLMDKDVIAIDGLGKTKILEFPPTTLIIKAEPIGTYEEKVYKTINTGVKAIKSFFKELS